MAAPKTAKPKYPEISFGKGLNTTQRNRLLLKDGESAGFLNADLDFFGGVTIKKKPALIKTGLGAVHSIYRTQQILFVGHSNILSAISAAGVRTDLVTGLTGARLTMYAVGNWLYVSDGANRRKVYIPTLAVFIWGFASPTAAPGVVAPGEIAGVQTSATGQGVIQGGNFVSDSGQNFVALGATVGMTVQNNTTGATMTIASFGFFMYPNDELVGVLTGGTRQTWEHGDAATIDPGGLAIASVCQAYIGEHAPYIDNAGRDLLALGLAPGMIVRNVPRATSYVITEIATTLAPNDTLKSATWDMFHHGEVAALNYGGSSGNPNGTYSCYLTYVAKYADGSEYETDLSPAGSATAATAAIRWTLPATAPDAQITHLRLYRDKTGLVQTMDRLRNNIEATQAAASTTNPLYGSLLQQAFRMAIKRETQKKVVQDAVQDQNVIVGPYLVTEIALGTTLYVDDMTDAALELKMPFTREMYLPVASYKKIVYKGKRIFGIDDSRLWWGAAYQPDALEPSWDGYNTTTDEEHVNTSLHEYAGFIYIGSRAGFMRLRGVTPADWSLDPTPATVGPLSDQTCAVTPQGIVFPRQEGFFLFNGYTSRLIAPQVKDVMDAVNWSVFAAIAFCTYDGRFYTLHYPSTGSQVVNRQLILDGAFGEANIRAAEGDFAFSAGFFDRYDQVVYYGSLDGVLYSGSGEESRTFEVVTKEYPTRDLLEAGEFVALHYEADTKGEDLTITAIYDGVEQASFTINTDGRTKDRIGLPQGLSYRAGLKIAATTTKDMILYEPWYLE